MIAPATATKKLPTTFRTEELARLRKAVETAHWEKSRAEDDLEAAEEAVTQAEQALEVFEAGGGTANPDLIGRLLELLDQARGLLEEIREAVLADLARAREHAAQSMAREAAELVAGVERRLLALCPVNDTQSPLWDLWFAWQAEIGANHG